MQFQHFCNISFTVATDLDTDSQRASWKCNFIVVDMLVTLCDRGSIVCASIALRRRCRQSAFRQRATQEIPSKQLNKTKEKLAGNWTLQPIPEAMQEMQGNLT